MKIALLGDMAFFGKMSIKNKNIFDYFFEVSSLLKAYDIVIGNLETPFVSSQKTFGAKSAHIKSIPENVELLKFLNIDIVNLANNHIYDYGREGLNLTKEVLSKNDIEFFGVDDKQVKIKFEDNAIALHGYCCYSTNPLGMSDGLNTLDISSLEYNIAENHKEGLFNIVSVHCGQEHIHYPNYDHLLMARKIAQNYPYLFYGHHPHVIQGIEKIHRSLIAYSLGNFCFDDVYTSKSDKPLIKLSEANKSSFILEIELENNEIINYETIPIYMDDDKMILNGSQILEEMEEINQLLKAEKSEYISLRQMNLINYINSRKEMRDLKWYLKRLNFSSVRMLWNAKSNSKRYQELIVEKLKQL